MPGDPKADRFPTRPDRAGSTVYDVGTGEPAVISRVPQTDISPQDACHTLSNRRANLGDRSVRQ